MSPPGGDNGKAPAAAADADAPLDSTPFDAAAGPSGSGAAAAPPPAPVSVFPDGLGDVGIMPALVVLLLVLAEWYRSSVAASRGCSC